MKRKVSVSEESEQDLTMEELKRTINQAKKNKAAGEDDVPYEFLQHLGPTVKQLLLIMFNICWAGEEIPGK